MFALMSKAQTKATPTPPKKAPLLTFEDIRPEKASFTLKSTGKKYTLRPVSMDDEIWLRERFGDDIEKIFTEIRTQEICDIVFHQLDEASKEGFTAQEVTIMNEEGEKITEKRGGSKLLRCFLIGFEDKMLVYNALMKTLGLSRPTVDKLIAAEDAMKAQSTEKKSL